MTGKHIARTPFAIESRQQALEHFVTELFPQTFLPRITVIANADLSDEQVIERAKSARYGDRFKRLWSGDASDYGNDHSRADLALCRILAFWCGEDCERVDRLFRRSGLMREKWDRRSGEGSYGTRTIGAAVNRGH